MPRATAPNASAPPPTAATSTAAKAAATATDAASSGPTASGPAAPSSAASDAAPSPRSSSSPRAASRRLASGERRRQILDAARGLLETSGIDEISVETVAKQVGVTPGLLFHYFGTQRRFRQAVVQAAARELLGQIEPNPAFSAAEQMHASLDTFIDYVARNPRLYLAVVRFSDAHRELRKLHSSIRAVMAGWLTEGLAAAGVPLTQPVRATLAGWLAFVEEVLLTWLDEPKMTRTELVEMCERACYVLLEVAVADPAAWPDLEAAIRRRP